MGYLTLLVCIFLIHLFCTERFGRNSDIELRLIFFLIFVFIGFRSNRVGSDTAVYVNAYVDIGSMQLTNALAQYKHGFEPGFIVFNNLMYRVLPFSQGILIYQGLFVALSYGYFVKKCCKADRFLSILIFMAFGLLNFHLTGIRQSMAMSICVLSYVMLLLNKKCQGWILTLVAITFHKSAIVCVVIYFMGFYWKKHNNWKTTVLSCALFYANAGWILRYVSTFRDKWDMYATIEATGNGFIFFLILIFVMILAEYVCKKFSRSSKIHQRIHYVAVIIWTGRLVSRTFERPALYALPASMALLPQTVFTFQRKSNQRVLYFGAVILTTAFYIYRYGGMFYSFCW